jgi:hypothetical protein
MGIKNKIFSLGKIAIYQLDPQGYYRELTVYLLNYKQFGMKPFFYNTLK